MHKSDVHSQELHRTKALFNYSLSVIFPECKVRHFTFVFMHLRNTLSLFLDNSISFLSNTDREGSYYFDIVLDKIIYLGD